MIYLPHRDFNGPGDSQAAFGGMIAPIAGTIAGPLLDTVVSSATAKRNTDATIAAQKRESELSYQRQIEMWRMQNEYNSPLEQMKRFGAAGLNPHLIYGKGTAGNADTMPRYQPADIQYRYQAPAYGAAVASMLPTLMQVGSWMQNMRLTETEIQQKQSSTARTQQLIEYLKQANPKLLQRLENDLSLYPYQQSMKRDMAVKMAAQAADFLEDFRYKYGAELEFEDLFKGAPSYRYAPPGRGLRGQQLLKAAAEARISGAKARWADWGVTDPQSLIQLVLGSVMRMAAPRSRMSFNRHAR